MYAAPSMFLMGVPEKPYDYSTPPCVGQGVPAKPLPAQPPKYKTKTELPASGWQT